MSSLSSELKKIGESLKIIWKSDDFCNLNLSELSYFLCLFKKYNEVVSIEKNNCNISEISYLKIKKYINKIIVKLEKVLEKIENDECVKKEEIHEIICLIFTFKNCLKNICIYIPNDCEKCIGPVCLPFKDINYDLYNSFNRVVFLWRVILENKKERKYNIRTLIEGTKADPLSPVYGYDCNSKLIKNGGLEKSYNPDFKNFNIRINYQNPSELDFFKPEVIEKSMEQITSYLAQRGFQFLPKDSLKKYKNYYFSEYVVLKFSKKCDSNKIPKYVDYWVGAEGTPVKYDSSIPIIKNGTVIPIRIPITTDCKLFNSKYEIEPIAHYNCIDSSITLHIPKTSKKFPISRTRIQWFGNIADIETSLMFFDATYSFIKRNKNNVLVKSSFSDFDYLAQCSEKLSYGLSFFNYGQAVPEFGLPAGDAGEESEEFLMYDLVALDIKTPENIKGIYGEIGPAIFGPQKYDITGTIVPTDPITAQVNGIPTINNPEAINGNIALIQRGGSSFTSKVKAAQNAGAIGCLIFNNVPGVFNMAGNDPTITIPSVMITQDLGVSILNNLPVVARLATDFFYNGDILFPYEGDNKKYDIYLYSLVSETANAFVNNVVTQTYLLGKNVGDNTSSTFEEGNEMQSVTTFLDEPVFFNDTGFIIPDDMFKGVYYPEESSIAPVPIFNPPAKETASKIALHEFVHVSQFAAGSLFKIPSEAIATSIEMNYRFFGSNLLFRPIQWVSSYLIPFFRGNYNPLFPELTSRIFLGVSTYGASVFWTYLSDQFDYNNQLPRRVTDLIAGKNVVNSFKENNLAYINSTSTTAIALSLDRALSELFNKNLKDTFTDYCIAQTLLRNNTSIPEKYRTYYPYWIYNTEYGGFPGFLERIGSYSLWWEIMQENVDMPINYSSFFPETEREKMIPLLNETFESDSYDLTNYSFTILPDIDNISIEVIGGEWKLTLMQFTSDGTKEGKFLIDGPHTIEEAGTHDFDVSPFKIENGSIRLVCSHVSVKDQGEMGNYGGNIDITGSIKIVPSKNIENLGREKERKNLRKEKLEKMDFENMKEIDYNKINKTCHKH